MKTIEEAIKLVQEFDFKSATQKEIEEVLPTFGMNDECPFEISKTFQPYMGWGIKFWQYPSQFSKLLCELKNKDISSYLELGVRWGGTFIILNELLLKYNPLLESRAMDIIPASDILDVYQNKFVKKNFIYHQMDTHDKFLFSVVENYDTSYNINKKIDLIFIDACHAYQCVLKDYHTSLMLGAKYIIFHDIVNMSTAGTIKAWKEIKRNHKKTYEFTDQYPDVDGKFLGIGLIEVTKEDFIFPMFKTHYHHLFDW